MPDAFDVDGLGEGDQLIEWVHLDELVGIEEEKTFELVTVS